MNKIYRVKIGAIGDVIVVAVEISKSGEFFIHEFVKVDIETNEVIYPLTDQRKKWVVSHRPSGTFMTKPLFKNHAVAAMKEFDALSNEIDWHSEKPYQTCSKEVWEKAKKIRFKFDNYA